MEESLIPSPPDVSALRESFGDRKPPEITRKITACVACRKQKIKCHMQPDGRPPCTRCKKRGLPCAVNRSLQMLLEDDVTWKHGVAEKIRRLEGITEQLTSQLQTPGAQPVGPPRGGLERQVEAPETSQYRPKASEEQTWELDPKCEPASIPASCISEMSNPSPREARTPVRPTLISRGILTPQEAEGLFQRYHERLDHLLYRILGDHQCLDTVVASSPLLTAAICAVAALHSQSLGHLFERCYNEFKQLVATTTFSREHNVDDVRGLCIGAFWLHELSWGLAGTAVRIALEIKLNHGIYQALKGDRFAYVQTRLYYLVYVCDHHCSVLYGRPPMSRDCDSIKAAMQFLETDHATEDDVRLVTQVKIWSISAAVFDTFGVDVDTPVPPGKLAQLRRFSIALDTWYADWSDRFGPNEKVGNYPAKGVGLHFHFAKLYLCSHAFRGAQACPDPKSFPSLEMEEIANTAVICAASILGVITSDTELQSLLNGLPLCFDTMIAFAVVFLLKVATKYADAVTLDKNKILSLVDRTIVMLQETTSEMHRQHLLVKIGCGVHKLRSKFSDGGGDAIPATRPSPQAVAPLEMFHADVGWVEDMSDFDMFNLQTPFPEIDPWPLDAESHHPL
ncbi:hypothetical protein P168DRAFT_228692 [Aspergillus campestris IBT 28561]|uniref:Zn(2)-C6 fungal-type domain-containing protein n=1 Tax=Aspergillus campestris (strain IBT 28561) TaxID=1392248 RepID=A0A2I1DDN7_ASPC2|nr:uncharacterized protein P168DRAFT_228692 [Aspergillus campestris IBT 28561]PKY07997.1 hypothetical protein P168DRAFT_228692 [Aspergillus campestris IBT 28561]